MKIIAIAGGSGAGKSTVTYKIADSNPDKYEVLNFDDYQKVGSSENLPKLAGMTNWDHPDIIRWEQLIRDIKKLKRGESITVESWSHRSNRDYHKHKKKLKRTIAPKSVLIIEGYLSLYNDELSSLYDIKIYLEVSEKVRNQRRDKGLLVTDFNYVEKVLNPMFKKYVEPTKLKADHVIDVSNKNIEEVTNHITQYI